MNELKVTFADIAFTETGSREFCLVEAEGHAGIHLAGFDLERLCADRLNEGRGNAYRKPGRYAILTSPAVTAPFIRTETRR
jgi:5-aminopentanamidase